MSRLRRFLGRLTEGDEERLAAELRTWAATVPGTVRIADAPPRSRVSLAGMVRRITVRPVEGFEALEVVLSDGTGEVVARWLGRRAIRGLALGSRLKIEGVLGLAPELRQLASAGAGYAQGGQPHLRVRVRRETASRLLALLLAAGIGVVGAWLGLAVAGRSSITAGPFRVGVGVQFGSGLTEVELPPLGHLTADTHTAPLRLTFSLQDVRAGQLSDLVRSGGVDEVVTSMQQGLASRLVALALRALGVALLGALVLAVLVYRTRWRLIAVALSAALVATGGSELATRMTYQVSAFQRPAFSGSLVLAQQLIGPVRTAADRLEAFREELGAVVTGAARVYASIPATPIGAPDEIRVLHISDIHDSPLGIEYAQRLAAAFDVGFVLDTGDLTSFGLPPEELILNAIPEFHVPYVFVRGNHDSHALQDEMQRIPNAIVLDGAAREIDGITVYGLGDPEFTPNKNSILSDEQFAAAVRAAGAVVGTEISILPRPPDIIAVHDDRRAGQHELSGRYRRLA